MFEGAEDACEFCHHRPSFFLISCRDTAVAVCSLQLADPGLTLAGRGVPFVMNRESFSLVVVMEDKSRGHNAIRSIPS